MSFHTQPKNHWRQRSYLEDRKIIDTKNLYRNTVFTINPENNPLFYPQVSICRSRQEDTRREVIGPKIPSVADHTIVIHGGKEILTHVSILLMCFEILMLDLSLHQKRPDIGGLLQPRLN